MDHLGGLLAVSRGPLGDMLGAAWASGAISGRIKAIGELSWAILAPSWAILGPFWAGLYSSGRSLEPHLGLLGALCGRFGRLLEP